MKEREERSGVILAIGVFKLVKALLLVAAGLGALKLLHGDAAQIGEQILERFPSRRDGSSWSAPSDGSGSSTRSSCTGSPSAPSPTPPSSSSRASGSSCARRGRSG